MKVSDIMSRGVVTATLETRYQELWRTIFKKHINAIPVVDKTKKLLGIITREDLLTPLYPDHKEFVASFTAASDFEEMENKINELSGLTAKDVMCKRVIYTQDDTFVMRALSRMLAREVDQLPVLSPKDKLVGMVTKGDIFYALFRRYAKRRKAKK